MADQTLRLRRDRLILCEGPDDQAFISGYLSHLHCASVEVRYPATNTVAAGNTQFGKYLGFQRRDPARSNWNALRRILIVTDGDGKADDAVFAMIADQIIAANLQPPATLGVLSGGSPAIEILIIPNNIETFCQASAVARSSHLAVSVQQFHDVVTAHNWNEQQRGKLWLRSYLAASHKKDSFIQFTTAFKVPEFCSKYFDLSHGSLAPLKAAIDRLIT